MPKKTKIPDYVSSEEMNTIRCYGNEVMVRLWRAEEYDQLEILFLYAKGALADMESKANAPHALPDPYGYSRGEYLRFLKVARAEGWEYDINPNTENSSEYWWAHGGTFEKVREDSLMTKLHNKFSSRR